MTALDPEAPTRSAEESNPSKRMKVHSPDALEQFAEDLADALSGLWNGDLAMDGLERVLASTQVVWHDSLRPGSALEGLPQLQALVTSFRAAFPDLRLDFQRPLHTGEEGLVLGYWRAEGTHTGPLGPALPPSGAHASWEGSILVRTTQLRNHHQPSGDAAAAAGLGAAGEDEGEGAQSAQRPAGMGQAHGGERPARQGGSEGEEAGGAQGSGSPKQEAQEVQEAGGAGGEAPGWTRRGTEVWWSWDPIFLFQQLGWSRDKPAGDQGEPAARSDVTERSAEGAQTAAAVAKEEEEGARHGAPSLELATRTAAAARDAYGTEEEAEAAAAAAVAAAAAAAERLPTAGASSADGAAALAAVQAANRAVVELYFHTYNTGHYRVLDHIVHPDYHYDGLLDLGDRRGRAAMAAMMGGWRDCLPDLAIGHELFAAVGRDRVAFCWVIQGTHSSPDSRLLGVPAAGARLVVKGVTTLTLRAGRICRKISHANAADTLRQLGVARPPAVPLRLRHTQEGEEREGEKQDGKQKREQR